MSISDNYSPDKSLGDGATTEFSGNWKVLNSSYFRLHLENATTGAQTLQTLGVDYTLTFDATGYVATMTTAPTSDNFVVRSRVVDIDQTDPYKTSKGFQGKTLEDSLDKLTAIDQDQNDGISRSLKFPIGSTGIVDGGLPTPVDNSLLSWDGVTGLVKNVTPASVDSSIDTLFSSLTSGDVIQYNGTVFVNKTLSSLLSDTVTTSMLKDNSVTPDKENTSVNALGDLGGGTDDIDLDDGRSVSATVSTATQTFTFSNPKPTGNEDIFTLRLTNGGSQTVNWPSSVDWAGGTAPSLTASGVDELTFKTIDGGTTWAGAVLLDVQ